MKLQQLRYLLAIVDNGLNITAAANQLYTSQPGVSKQLKLLEEELGVQLFVRHGKSLTRVTAAGRQVIVHARVVMQEVDGIRSLCRELVNDELHIPPTMRQTTGARHDAAITDRQQRRTGPWRGNRPKYPAPRKRG